MEEQIVSGVLLITALLSVSVLSSFLLKKINFPYTIGLVVVGLLLGFLSYDYETFEIFRHPELSPGIILYLVLPTLIFEAAMNIDFSVLRRNLIPILLLAVFGLLISAFVVGAGVSLFTPLGFMTALVFGALISATDPVAVIALFNEVGAPKRLVTLIDGESIFNDATAIVLFGIVMAMAATPGAKIDVLKSGIDFTMILVGGVCVGALVGAAGSFVNHFVKNNLLNQITISVVMAYLSFVVSDHFLHFSGVMATLGAGLVMRAGMEKTVRRSNIVTMEHFWEYFAFIANSIIFLLLGLTEFHIIRSGESIPHLAIMILCVIPTVVVARLACVYLLMPLYNAFIKDIKDKIPAGYQAILFWGGLRGAVPVALVLAIPADFPHRILIIQFTFAFIMFTLLFQGTTIKRLMGKLGIRPEANEFADIPVERHEFDFKNDKLAALVAQSLRDMFDDEAFFIRDKSSLEQVAFLAQRGKIMFLTSQEEDKVAVVCERDNAAYFKHLLYETLLHLNDAVKDIRDVAEHDKISGLVSDAKHSEFKIPFNVMKHLSKSRMSVGVKPGSKSEVIESLVRRLVDSGDIRPDDFIPVLDRVLEREESMTTALGDNIAIPHVRKCEFVKKLTALVATAPEGIDFNAVDGKPVKIFILLLSPLDAVEPHVQFMAAMGKLLIDPVNRETIVTSQNVDELYANIERIAKETAK